MDLAGPLGGTPGLSYRLVLSGDYAHRSPQGYRDRRSAYIAPSIGWRDATTQLVVGAQRILEVQQAHPGGSRPFGQPDEVLGVIVAVAKHGRAPLAPRPDGRPERVPGRHGIGREGRQAREFRPPFEKGVRPHLQGQAIIGQQGPGQTLSLQYGRRPGLVQLDLHVHRRRVERGFRRALGDEGREEAVPQVLDQGQSGGGVEGHDGRR